jgi:chitinase
MEETVVSKKHTAAPVKQLVAALAVAFTAAHASALTVAPYFETWSYNDGSQVAKSLMDAKTKAGLNAATLAFLVANGGCKVDNSVSQMQSDISAFQAAGGKAIISFGGADGTYVEAACSAPQLFTLIDGILQSSGVRAIDFDVEGNRSARAIWMRCATRPLFSCSRNTLACMCHLPCRPPPRGWIPTVCAWCARQHRPV